MIIFEKTNEEMQGLKDRLQFIKESMDEEKRILSIKHKSSSAKSSALKLEKLRMEYISTDIKLTKLSMKLKDK